MTAPYLRIYYTQDKEENARLLFTDKRILRFLPLVKTAISGFPIDGIDQGFFC